MNIELEGYRRMLCIRGFEQAVTRLINEGEVPGAFHSSIGQEAAIVGACMALRNDDYLSGTHRSHETAKAVQELEAPASGILAEILLAEGEEAEIRTPIAFIETQ